MRYSFALACAMLATPLAAQDTRVVTDFQVTHSLVSMVMGDTGTLDLLLDQGGDPHSFQLRPSQARALSEADVIFWVGAELAPWMARALEGTEARGHLVTLLQAEGVTLQDFAHGHSHDDHGHSNDDHGHSHDHGPSHDDHGHSHGHDHSHDDHGHAHDHDNSHDDHGHTHDREHSHDDHGDSHDHGQANEDHGHSYDGIDPHAWLNTENAKVWLNVIAAELGAHDPENADTFRANAEAAQEQIAALSAELEEILAPVGDTALVVFHDAYGYLATQFGLNVAGTIALGDAAAPGAQRLSELRAQLHDSGAVCIFPEVNHSARFVDVVVEGTGVRIGTELDPAGVMLEPGADLYPTLMRNLAQSIADCVAG
ncbi:MAG: zinc ABC transporter substrate-binding protein [Rhodobacteraceae bacterium]|nr:MAG: zinc ABC transporter substrate-binding protein [Paracoccaceae bacterium]